MTRPTGGGARTQDWKQLAEDMGEALVSMLQHPDHVSDEVRKARNKHALGLLARLHDLAAGNEAK